MAAQLGRMYRADDLEPHEAALRARLDDESDAVRDAAHHALSPDEEGTPPSSDVDED